MKDLKLIPGITLIVLGTALAVIGQLAWIPILGLIAYPVLIVGVLMALMRLLKSGRWNREDILRDGALILLGLLLMLYSITEAFGVFILVGIAIAGYGAYRFRKSAGAPDIREDEQYREGDEELGGELGRLQRTMRLLSVTVNISFVACIAAFFIGAATNSFVGLIIIAIIAAILYEIRDRHGRKIKNYVAENIVRQSLEEVFDVSEYKPFGHIEHSRIAGADFGIGSFDRIGGTDYVRGFYKGLAIEMCDMKLTRRESRTDENGHREEYDEVVFRGFWLICDFGKELSAQLRLWEREKLGKLLGGGGIVTDNEQFNKQFRIESEIEHEAFYILTPHMMEYILEMDKRANGRTHMRFDRDGRVQIAISTGRDGFEVGKNVKNATLLRKQFVQELRYITDIIDELKLVDTLYKE